MHRPSPECDIGMQEELQMEARAKDRELRDKAATSARRGIKGTGAGGGGGGGEGEGGKEGDRSSKKRQEVAKKAVEQRRKDEEAANRVCMYGLVTNVRPLCDVVLGWAVAAGLQVHLHYNR